MHRSRMAETITRMRILLMSTTVTLTSIRVRTVMAMNIRNWTGIRPLLK